MENYFRDVGATALVGADEEQGLAFRIRVGDLAARDHLIRANLRLVVLIARHYAKYGIGLDDLIQEGNLGLLHAVERFDPSRKVRFCTYAAYWIRQSIQQAVERLVPVIRVPAYAVDLVAKWRQAANKLLDKLGRPAREDEIAAALSLTPRQVKIITKALQIYNQRRGSALDDERDGAKLLGLTGAQPQPGSSIEKSDELRKVLQCVGKLENREGAVLRMRYGLEGEPPMHLQEIGNHLGVTRERIRQIERSALAKLQGWLGDPAE